MPIVFFFLIYESINVTGIIVYSYKKIILQNSCKDYILILIKLS